MADYGISPEDVMGRIISLQSVKYDGSYADCHHSFKLHITQCDYNKVPNAEWTRLIVHEGNDGTILMESLKYRNHYVDAYHDGEIHLTHSPNPPISKEWAQWRLVHVREDIYALQSNRYTNSYLDAYHSGIAHVTKGSPDDIWAQWKLGIGPGEPITDGMEVVTSFHNKLDTPAELTYMKKLGISVTKGSSTKFTESLGYEMQTNFSQGPISDSSKYSISFSYEWQRSTAQTWSEEVEIETKVEVMPKQKVIVTQLVGKYGPLKVHSNYIEFSFSPDPGAGIEESYFEK